MWNFIWQKEDFPNKVLVARHLADPGQEWLQIFLHIFLSRLDLGTTETPVKWVTEHSCGYVDRKGGITTLSTKIENIRTFELTFLMGGHDLVGYLEISLLVDYFNDFSNFILMSLFYVLSSLYFTHFCFIYLYLFIPSSFPILSSILLLNNLLHYIFSFLVFELLCYVIQVF